VGDIKVILKEFRFYEFDSKRSVGWWMYSAEQLDIEINIQGNEQGPDKEWFNFASDILDNHYEEVLNLAQNRLKQWGESTDKEYFVERFYFGKFSYGPEQTLMSGFKIILKTNGTHCEDVYGTYTINFNESKWPIGYEFSIA